MKERILIIWGNVKTSYWFIPSIMICGVWLILNLMLKLDDYITGESWILSLSWVRFGSLEGARQLLVTIVGSLINVIGLLFSMTMIVFTLASSQYGPQVMRHFMADRVTQVVLGTLVSTFIYCLLILRSIGMGIEKAFIPHISITFALFLTIVSLWILIYFIHHVSVRVQPQSIIRDLGRELIECFSRQFPEQIGKEGDVSEDKNQQDKLLKLFESQGQPIYSKTGGYVQAIANEDIMDITEKYEIKIKLHVTPGEFIVENIQIATIFPEQENQQEISKIINEVFIIGQQRTVQQDIKYAIEKMDEIAVRALSPGINEPFICVMCIDYLSLALNQLCQRSIPSPWRANGNGELCVYAKRIGFKEIIETALNPILHYGEANPQIKEYVIKSLRNLKETAFCPEYKKIIETYIVNLK